MSSTLISSTFRFSAFDAVLNKSSSSSVSKTARDFVLKMSSSVSSPWDDDLKTRIKLLNEDVMHLVSSVGLPA